MSKTQKHINSMPESRTKRALTNILGANWPQIVKTLFESSNGEIGTASGAGLSPAIWSDCPRGLMVFDPTLGHFVGEDFTQSKGTSYTTANDYTLAGANGTFTHVASDPDGVALVNAPNVDNNEANVNVNSGVGLITTSATKTWWFESRVKLNQIAAAQGAFVGLVGDQITLGVDFMTDDTMALKVQSLLGFQVLAATDIAAVWQSIHSSASARAAVNATLATASTGWVKLGMKCSTNGTVGTVKFFVNGVQDGSTLLTSAANFPVDLYMVPAWAIKTGKVGTAASLSIDWWYAAQLR